MKTLILTLVSLLSTLPAFASEPEFSCINRAYRDAALEYSLARVVIQDSALEKEKLEKIVQAKLGTENLVWVDTVKLVLMRDQNLRCSSTFTYLVKCQGASSLAALDLNGIVAGNAGREFRMTIPVGVKEFNLATILRKEDPIRLGEKGVEIKMDQVAVSSEAKLEIDGAPVDLNFDVFFSISSTHDVAGCQKL